MQKYNDPGFINIGTGQDLQIMELAKLVKSVVGFEGNIVTDTSMPDGTPRKLMDVSRLKNLGWSPSVGLTEGVAKVYQDFQQLSFAQ